MRRRSERKKSVDPSPVTSSRRSSRRTSRRTPDVEKTEDSEAQQHNETPTKTEDSSPNRASSEERIEINKRGARSTRTARAKRNLRTISGADTKIDAITEEENGIIAAAEVQADNLVNVDIPTTAVTAVVEEEENKEETIAIIEDKVESSSVVNKCEIVKNVQIESNSVETAEETPIVNLTEKFIRDEDVEMKEVNVSENKSNYNEEQNITEVLITGNANVDTGDADADAADDDGSGGSEKDATNEVDQAVVVVIAAEEVKTPNGKDEQIEQEEPPEEHAKEKKREHTKKLRTLSNHSNVTSQETSRTRKRKWLSKKTSENKEPILAISTDSLKNLIADVQPVPLSDVKLESSSEVEEVPSEHNAREISSSPSEHERRRSPLDKVITDQVKPATDTVTTTTTTTTSVAAATASNVPRTGLPLQSSPSPPRNQTSNVLFITNLVRPFTVMQLKGLLARTGKIVENGFWIDRIKSKCYVQYETEE